MRLVGHRRRGLLVSSPTVDDDEEEEREEKGKAGGPEAKAGLAFVVDLDFTTMLAGEGCEAWLAACGEPTPGPGGEFLLDPIWIAQAAARSEVAVFLAEGTDSPGAGARIRSAARTARSFADTIGRPRPKIFGGPVWDSDPAAAAGLAGHVDGLVLRTRNDPEPAVEAERLRRACATVPELLLTGSEGWTYAPAVMALGRPDALALIPAAVLEWSLSLDDPGGAERIQGRLLAALDAAERPWWGRDYFVCGPDSLRWRSWASRPTR